MDLYVGTTLNPRFIRITNHVAGEIVGFFGVGYDPEGISTGDIVGTIEGQTIIMHYSRTTGYTADFTGTIADNGNSMSGQWSDYARTNEPWNMVRQ